MIFFGLIGYGLRLIDMPPRAARARLHPRPAALEVPFRRTLTFGGGDFSAFVTQPLAASPARALHRHRRVLGMVGDAQPRQADPDGRDTDIRNNWHGPTDDAPAAAMRCGRCPGIHSVHGMIAMAQAGA